MAFNNVHHTTLSKMLSLRQSHRWLADVDYKLWWGGWTAACLVQLLLQQHQHWSMENSRLFPSYNFNPIWRSRHARKKADSQLIRRFDCWQQVGGRSSRKLVLIGAEEYFRTQPCLFSEVARHPCSVAVSADWRKTPQRISNTQKIKRGQTCRE